MGVRGGGVRWGGEETEGISKLLIILNILQVF